MVVSRLSLREKIYTWAECQDKTQVQQVKSEWYHGLHDRLLTRALETLKNNLIPKSIRSERILYDPIIWFDYHWPASVVGCHTIKFSTPNKAVPFDYYPNEKAKLGVIAHEAFGHPADRQQYYLDDHEGLFVHECETYVTPEQRANLHVMHISPNIMYERVAQDVHSDFRLKTYNSSLGGYEESLIALLTLGISGLPRRDNIVEYIKELNANASFSGRIFIHKFLLAGLATPPNLNCETKYGIKTRNGLFEARQKVLNYIRGKINEPPKLITYTEDNYRPEYSIDLRWIDKAKTLEELEKAMSYWQNRFRRHNRFACFQDMYESLQIISHRIKNGH